MTDVLGERQTFTISCLPLQSSTTFSGNQFVQVLDIRFSQRQHRSAPVNPLSAART
jgi:hypothetical protein